MKIGIYLDKFNPITTKQISLALNIRKKYKLDEIWFLVDLNDNNQDVSLLNKLVYQAIKPYRKFKVLYFYNQNIDNTLTYLNRVNKNNHYIFISNELLDKELVNEFIYVNSFEDWQKEIREGKFINCPKVNKNTIIESGIYAESIVQAQVNEKRFQHSLSVGKVAKEIAEKNNLDVHKAYLIGIYHDIAKGLDYQQLESYMNLKDYYERSYHYYVWHQCIGSYLLRHRYNMRDKTILKAIAHHCLGDNNDIYSKLIFIADKVDPLRGYDSSKLIEIACQDINKGFELVKKENEEYLKKEGKIA